MYVCLSATERLKSGVFKQLKRRSVEIDRWRSEGLHQPCLSTRQIKSLSSVSFSLSSIEESEDF